MPNQEGLSEDLDISLNQVEFKVVVIFFGFSWLSFRDETKNEVNKLRSDSYNIHGIIQDVQELSLYFMNRIPKYKLH